MAAWNLALRFGLELGILAAGTAAVTFAGQRNIGIAFAVLVVLYYAASTSRIEWLIQA